MTTKNSPPMAFSNNEKKITLEVKGMMCQKSCGSTIENALRSMEGVIKAEASFMKHEAYATIDSSKLSANDLIDTIECIGFEAFVPIKKKKVILKVDGMMCQKSCGTTVTNALQSVSGVVDAKASFIKSQAYAAIDASTNATTTITTANNLIDMIECIGFDASLPYTRVVLSIEGMMCQKSCGSTVENSLTSTKGVLYAHASFVNKDALVIIDKDIMNSVSDLVDAIEAIGFEASIQSDDPYDFEEMLELSSFNDKNDNDTSNNNNHNDPLKDLIISEQDVSTVSTDLETLPLGEGESSSNILTFQVGGMSCAVCSGKVQRTLEGVEGVVIASVILTTQRAQVELHSDVNECDKQDIADECCKVVESKGYECEYMNMNNFSLKDNADSIEKARKEEINGWVKLLILSVLLTLPLLYIMKTTPKTTMVDGEMLKHPCVMWRLWTICILSTTCQFTVGYRFYKAAYNSGYDWGMDFLVVLGTSCAYVYSLVVFAIIIVNPNNHFELEPSFSTGPMLLSFVTLGKFLESYAKGKTAAALQSLCELQPMFATKVMHFEENDDDDDDVVVDTSALQTEEVSAWDLYPGNYIRVLPGARIPADGILVAVGGGSSGGGGSSNDGKSKKKQRQEAYIDESAFSGEPIPVSKRIGDSLYGSSVNQLSVLVVKVTATGAETVLAKIVKLMEDAQRNQAPIQAFADYAASIFAPCIICIAAVTLFMWIIVGEEENLKIRVFQALMSAISVIVVACPCALGLATPTAVMVGTGVGATHGLLIKGGAVLEETHSINKIILDKTGTCTTGKVVLGHRLEFVKNDNSNDDLLQNLPSKIDHTNLVLWLSSCAEIQSEHPLARAIVNSARSMWGADVTFSNEGVQVTDFNVVPGFGVECCVYKPNWGSYTVRIGSRQFTKEENENGDTEGSQQSDDSTGDKEVKKLRNKGEIAVYVSVLKNTTIDLLSMQQEQTKQQKRRIIGVLGIIDPIKKEARSTVKQLQNMGIDVYMCTGDHELTASSVAKQIGIPMSNVRSSMKPEQKAEMVSELQNQERKKVFKNRLFSSNSNQERSSLPTFDIDDDDDNDGIFRGRNNKNKNTVAMVGDGINDAIALARSNVGIAIGAGTEVAVEAANIVLLRSNLYDVVIAIHLSKVVFKRIQMNFVWAMGYNALAIPFASGLMFPITGFRLPPEYAGLMMAFSSVSVVTSSLLLRNYKVPKMCNNVDNDNNNTQKYTDDSDGSLGGKSIESFDDEIELV